MNKLFVFTGESSSGKDTIIKHLMNYIKEHQLNILKFPSYTSRPKRFGEVNGDEYYFVDNKTFDKHYKEGKVVEYNTYNVKGEYWFYYSLLEQINLKEHSYVKICNPSGTAQLKSQFKGQVVTIHINCPSDIRKQRYMSRGTLDDSWERRYKQDIKDFKYFKANYEITNDGTKSLDKIVQEIINIITKEME